MSESDYWRLKDTLCADRPEVMFTCLEQVVGGPLRVYEYRCRTIPVSQYDRDVTDQGAQEALVAAWYRSVRVRSVMDG